jgi:hypothetical protein
MPTDITINTPALLFPAISLIMLAYTNRFVAISGVVRALHDRYKTSEEKPLLHAQIRNLRFRIRLIRQMQFLGVASFLLGIVTMYLIYLGEMYLANRCFAVTMLLFAISLLLSMLEIHRSTVSLELELSDMDDLETPRFRSFFRRNSNKK